MPADTCRLCISAVVIALSVCVDNDNATLKPEQQVQADTQGEGDAGKVDRWQQVMDVLVGWGVCFSLMTSHLAVAMHVVPSNADNCTLTWMHLQAAAWTAALTRAAAQAAVGASQQQ
jgi:hypothetical protein